MTFKRLVKYEFSVGGTNLKAIRSFIDYNPKSPITKEADELELSKSQIFVL